jgi:hypothetical protein
MHREQDMRNVKAIWLILGLVATIPVAALLILPATTLLMALAWPVSQLKGAILIIGTYGVGILGILIFPRLYDRCVRFYGTRPILFAIAVNGTIWIGFVFAYEVWIGNEVFVTHPQDYSSNGDSIGIPIYGFAIFFTVFQIIVNFSVGISYLLYRGMTHTEIGRKILSRVWRRSRCIS